MCCHRHQHFSMSFNHMFHRAHYITLVGCFFLRFTWTSCFLNVRSLLLLNRVLYRRCFISFYKFEIIGFLTFEMQRGFFQYFYRLRRFFAFANRTLADSSCFLYVVCITLKIFSHIFNWSKFRVITFELY